MRRHVLAAILAGMAAVCASADDLPPKPLPTVAVKLTDGKRDWIQQLPVRRKTADRSFWLSTVASIGANVLDVENSHYALEKSGAVEANPLFGRHPSRAAYYGITIPLTAINIAFSYHYKRQDDALRDASLPPHKYAKWWLPNLINAVGHGAGTAITLGATGR